MNYLLIVLIFLSVNSYYKISHQTSTNDSITDSLYNGDPKTKNPTRFDYLTLTINFITNTEVNIRLVPDEAKYDLN